MADFIFWGSKITADGDCSHDIKEKKKLAPWKESYDKPRQHIKKQRHYFVNKEYFPQTWSLTLSPAVSNMPLNPPIKCTVRVFFWGAPKSLQMVTAAMTLKDAYSLEGKL